MRQHATVSYTGGERWTTEKAGKPGEKRPRLRWIKRMALLKQDKNNRQEEKTTTTPRRKTTMMRTGSIWRGEGKKGPVES
jgi:hypothetical protein